MISPAVEKQYPEQNTDSYMPVGKVFSSHLGLSARKRPAAGRHAGGEEVGMER